MAKQSVEKRLLQAQSLLRKGAFADARAATHAVIADYPANKKAKQLLAKINQTAAAGPVARPQSDQDKIAGLVQTFESGDIVGAAELASRYSKQFPRSALVWNVGAAANKLLGRSENAIHCFERVVQINPTDADAHFNLGVLLQEEGRLRAASDSYRRALALRPNDAEAHNNLGKALEDLGEADDYIEHYERATELNPNYAQAFYNLGVIRRTEHLEVFKAIDAFKRTLELEPDNIDALDNLATSYLEYGNAKSALDCYARALKVQPDSARLMNGHSQVLMDTGRTDEAVAQLKKTLRLHPNSIAAHRKFGVAQKYVDDDPRIPEMLRIYDEEDLSESDRCTLCFALSKAYEDIEDFETSFRFLTEGNSLRKSILKYTLETDLTIFENIKKLDLGPIRKFAKRQSQEFEPTPIFILGMPRSGTTLTEQIVSSHSQVYGAGELGFVAKLGLRLALGKAKPDTATLDAFQSAYGGYLRKVSDGQPFVVDKMPHNFRFIGLICELFPNAKIVHMRRDARAVCWSNYKIYFPANGLGYTFDLADTVAYYKMYQDLVAFWDKQYSDRIIHLDYDALTQNQEELTKNLISDLGLDWEDGCLSPHENKRMARTASSQQVKQKVYTGSSEKWRSFAPYLDGALDTL